MARDKSPHRRRRLHRRLQTAPVGAPPGTLISQPGARLPEITVIRYDTQQFAEKRLTAVSELPPDEESCVTWINIDGLGDADTVGEIGQRYHLHRLALEDVLNTCQRAKVDHFDPFLFLVAHVPTKGPEVQTEQLSLFLLKDTVITFQHGHPGDPFEPVRQRLRKGGPARARGADYLMYALLDAAVDGYFPVLERLDEQLADLEESILNRPDRAVMHQVYEMKRNLLTLRRALWPLREATNTLVRDPHPLVAEETRLHLRDCHDHVVRVLDFVENFRELCADLTDLLLSSLSQRMGEVIKVLTMISTIFIPLTFITSIYGMNFNTEVSPYNMPELGWRFGYLMILGVMLTLAVILLLAFWRAGWFRSSIPEHREGTRENGKSPGNGPRND